MKKTNNLTILFVMFLFTFNICPAFGDNPKVDSFVYPIKHIDVYNHKGIYGKIILRAKCGEPLKVITSEDYWLYVEDNNGIKGWVQEYLVRDSKELTASECEKLVDIYQQIKAKDENRTSKIKAEPGGKVYVNVQYPIALYKMPSLPSPVAAGAHFGETLYIITKNPDWTEVKTVNGHQGWIANKWITEDYEQIREYIENKNKEEQLKKKAELAKDVQKKETIIEIENVLKTIPSTDYERNYNLYRQLQDLEPDNALYNEKTNYYYQQKNKARKQKKEQEVAQKKASQRKNENEKLSEGYILKLNGWHWEESYGYVKAIGSVKNISNKKIERLRVVVSWFDKDNNLITYDTSYVEYITLMPGQTTPFSVMESYNPRMKKAQINFILESGNTPLWYTD